MIEGFDLVELKWIDDVELKGELPNRFAHSLVTYKEDLWMFGGTDGKKDFNDLYTIKVNVERISDEESNVFQKISAQSSLVHTTGKIPHPRSYHSACTMGQRMFLFGGKNDSNFLNDLFVLDVETRTWHEILLEGPPSPRCASSACMVEGQLFLYGGFDGKQVFSDFFCLHNCGDQLSSVPSFEKAIADSLKDNIHCDFFFENSSGNKFGAHRVIVFSKFPSIEKFVERNSQGFYFASLGEANKEVSLSFLEYLYTGSCSFFLENTKTLKGEEVENNWNQLQAVSEKFGLSLLSNFCKTRALSSPVKIELEPNVFLEGFFDNQKYSDIVILTLDGKKIFAHRTILSSRSEYFNMMLTSIFSLTFISFFSSLNFRSKGSLKESNEIQINASFEYELLRHVIYFLYTDRVLKNLENEEDPNLFISLLEICHLLKVEKMKLICEEIVSKFVEIENAAYLYHLSFIYDCKWLEKKAVVFISNNMKQMFENEYYQKELPKELKKRFAHISYKNFL